MSLKIREIADQIIRNIEENMDTSLVEYLLDNKPILRRIAGYRLARDEADCFYFWTALHAAARHGRSDLLKLFDQGGCMMENQDEKKRSPLWYAAAYNYADTVDRLLEAGAKPKHADSDGWTPLHAAARHGHIKICQILVDHGCDVVQPDNAGFTALHKAIWGEHEDTAAYLLHVSQRSALTMDMVSVCSLDNRISPLHLAVQRGLHSMVNMLLEHGAAVDERNRDGLTPLMIACQIGDYSIADLLLQAGASPHRQTSNGWTPLHMAVEKGSYRITVSLLNKGANVDARNKHGWTPFLLAAKLGQMDAMRTLRDHGADCRTRTSEMGYSAVHLAAQQGNAYALRYLLTEVNLAADIRTVKTGQTPLHLAAARGHLLTSTTLLDHGCPLDALDANGHSALHLAAKEKQISLVKFLLTRGGSLLHAVPVFSRTKSMTA